MHNFDTEPREHQVSKQFLRKIFARFLPQSAILIEQEQLKVYECDGLLAYPKLPWMVLLPETTDQVQRILKLCHQYDVPVVARGAGTGLSGGAIPISNGILLSLAKFSRILSIDVDNKFAVVQPGVRNIAISQAVAPSGLYYAPDPSSQIACTIGGNVAENSGGVHCLKYGLTTHNILRVQLLTMQGELLTVGGHGLDACGFDLLALICGSEGMLGIIVEVTVKLLPIPACAKTLMAAFNRVEKASHAVATLIAQGLVPAGLEMMDQAALQAAEDFVHAGYPVDAQAILLCEVDGVEDQAEEECRQAIKLLRNAGAAEINIAQNTQDRERMWAGRKSAFPAVGRLSPDYYCMDGTIPRRNLADVLAKISALSRKYGLAVANVFHAGDGNLHPLILYDANVSGQLQKAEQFGAEILEISIAAGGTITGEHGVGIEKINHMCLQFKQAEIALFHAIKKAFDDKGLLNPGKAVPTLQRCAEFGAMHVHAGEINHPELERF